MLGPATARWNDYVGTAAADDADVLRGSRSPYELAGIDRDRWAIVAVDLDRGEHGERVTIYATDRQEYAHLQSGSAGGALDDEVPVTAFHLEGARRVDDFINGAFKRIQVRLNCRSAGLGSLSIERCEHLSSDSAESAEAADSPPVSKVA